MKKQPKRNREVRGRPVVALLNCALAIGIACLAACGRADKAPEAGAPAAGAPTDAPPHRTSDSSASASRAAASTSPSALEARAVNLREFAMIEGGEIMGRSPANLSYKAKGEVKSGYEFHRRQLLALGWNEEADASVTEQAASGTFTGAGYTVSISVFPSGEPGSITVMLHNHGNVNLASLPLPPGTKPVYVGPLNSMHVTEMTVDDTTSKLRTLLIAGGWEPHGSEGDSWHYKQGLNRLSVTISPAPAQGGKTMITYANALMSGDLPAPPDALDVRYADTRQELTFVSPAAQEAILEFYRKKLTETGWRQVEDQMQRGEAYDQMTFRTPDGAVIFLKISPEREGKRNGSLSYLSADDIAELKKAKPPEPKPAEKEVK